MFFVSASLVIVTVGIFSGKSNFAGQYVLAYWYGGRYIPVASAPVSSITINLPLSFFGTNQATLNSLPLYYYNFVVLAGAPIFF
jgi:hypothetical protein